ncbi:hypothetical protein CLAFUR0_03697 [Fulvia fulva]|nr:hypothetical protein CLAFUR0_03697 [Fulvia fulva]
MFPLTPSSPSPSMTFLAPALPFLKWKGTFQQYKYLATIPEECSPPIMTTSYLATSLNFGNPPFSRLNELKNWLKGYITTPDFFTKEPRHALDDLHAALLAVAKEIGMKLDPELEATIHTAGDESHSIQCDEDSFWTTRVLDVHKLCTTGLIGIKTLSRERVIALLLIARDEVQWVANEIRRLDVHCKNAADLKGCKNRESFSYYPSPRKELAADLKNLKGSGVMVRLDGKAVDVDDMDELLDGSEIKDEDMIDAEKEIEEERRDSKDIVGNVKRENLDYLEL